MKNIRKITATVLAFAMVVSVASCSKDSDEGGKKKNKDDEASAEVVDVADGFFAAVVDGDSKKASKYYSSEWEDDEELETILNYKNIYTDDKAKVLETIAGTIEYEIDEETVTTKKKTATVDVTFSVADYTEIEIDGFWGSVDEIVDAVNKADTKETTIKIEMELEDDVWVVSNPDEVIEDVFEFEHVSFQIMELTLNDFITGYDMDTLVEEDKGISLALCISPDIESYKNIDRTITYTVRREGRAVYTSDTLDAQDGMIYGEEQGAEFESHGLLMEGKYEIEVFNSEGVSLTVVTYDISYEFEEETKPEVTGDDEFPAGDVYVASFDASSYIIQAMAEYEDEGAIELKSSLIFHVFLVLGEDGQVTLMTQESDLRDSIVEFYKGNLDVLLEATTGMSMSEIEKVLGMSTDEIIDLVMEDFDFSEVVISTSVGRYEISGNTLYIISGSEKTEFEITDDGIKFDASDVPELVEMLGEDYLMFVPYNG